MGNRAGDGRPITRPGKKTPLILNERLVFYRPLFLCLGVLGICQNLVFPVLSRGYKQQSGGNGEKLSGSNRQPHQNSIVGGQVVIFRKTTRGGLCSVYVLFGFSCFILRSATIFWDQLLGNSVRYVLQNIG